MPPACRAGHRQLAGKRVGADQVSRRSPRPLRPSASSRKKWKSICSSTEMEPNLSKRFFSSMLSSEGMSRRIVSSHLSCSMNFSPSRLQREQRNFRYIKLGPNTLTYQLRCNTSLATIRCPQWQRTAVVLVFMLLLFAPRPTEKGALQALVLQERL